MGHHKKRLNSQEGIRVRSMHRSYEAWLRRRRCLFRHCILVGVLRVLGVGAVVGLELCGTSCSGVAEPK